MLSFLPSIFCNSSSLFLIQRFVYAGVAAVTGLAAAAPLRPRGSSSDSSSLGGRLSSCRRFLRLLVIYRLLASGHHSKCGR
jgi:hypothetical protein